MEVLFHLAHDALHDVPYRGLLPALVDAFPAPVSRPLSRGVSQLPDLEQGGISHEGSQKRIEIETEPISGKTKYHPTYAHASLQSQTLLRSIPHEDRA